MRISVENSGILVENKTFSQKYLAVPNILLIFATANKTIVDYPAGRPFRLWLLAAGFLYAKEYLSSQLENFIFLTGKKNMADA